MSGTRPPSSFADNRVEPALAEAGHYSYSEVCQAALVVKVKDAGFRVNVVAFDSDGTIRPHEDVPVRQPTPDDGGQSFHLWHNCPWGR